MAISYEWNCKTCDVYPEYEDEDDVVYTVHYRLTATSSETDAQGVPYTSTTYGSESLTLGDLSNFIPFSALTNAVTTGWVEEAMDAGQVQKMKDNLDSKIAKQITPTSETKTIN